METNYRRCISCRRVAHRNEFFRVVRNHQTRQVTLDEGMGRSAYLCPSASCIKQAQRKNRLSRVLKSQVKDSLYDFLWQRVSQAPTAQTIEP